MSPCIREYRDRKLREIGTRCPIRHICSTTKRSQYLWPSRGREGALYKQKVYIRISLVEEIKWSIGFQQPSPLNLRQELELINLPAIDFLSRLLVPIQLAILFQLSLEQVTRDIWVILLIIIFGRKVCEYVNGRVVADALVEIGEDEQLVRLETRTDAVELCVQLCTILAMANLQHRLDEAQKMLRKRCAEFCGSLVGGIERHGVVVARSLVGIVSGRLVDARRRLFGRQSRQRLAIVLLPPEQPKGHEEEGHDANGDATQAFVQEEEPDILRLRRLGEECHDRWYMALGLARWQRECSTARRDNSNRVSRAFVALCGSYPGGPFFFTATARPGHVIFCAVPGYRRRRRLDGAGLAF